MNDEYSSNEEEAKITFRNIPAEDHKSFMTNRIWGGLQAGGLKEKMSTVSVSRPI